MLSELRKLIESQNNSDDMLDIMMEALDDSIANAFIEDDGEAEIAESDVIDILNKIPEYDENKELNKKLDRITESYIPEYTVLNEGFKEELVRLQRSFSAEGRDLNKIDYHLENVRRKIQMEFESANTSELKEMKKGLMNAIKTNKAALQNETDQNVKKLMQKHTDWMENFVEKIDRKLR